MKFKLVENFDETRSMVQEYMYDVILKLGNSSLEKYIQYFKAVFDPFYDETVEQAVTDAYIEACDYGMIKGVEKTRLTSELREYIESNSNLLDNVEALMNNCPGHLRHELQLALDVAELNESLNEELLTEASNSVTKAFSDAIMQGRTSNARGADKLSNKELSKYDLEPTGTNDYYVIHHKDGNHNNHAEGNEYIITHSDHGRIHNKIRNEIEKRYFSSKESRDIIDYMASVKQIQAFVAKLIPKAENAGLDSDKVQFLFPSLEDSDILKLYKELTDPDNTKRKQLYSDVFDDYFKEVGRIPTKYTK